NYVRTSRLDFLLSPTVQRMAAFGLCPWIVWPDYDQNLPVIEMRDPRGCYPEPGLRQGERARNCMFTREHYFSQLNRHYQNKLLEYTKDKQHLRTTWEKNAAITIIEWVDEKEFIVAALLKSGYQGAGPNPGQFSTIPVELDRWDHGLSACPVVLGERFTTDGQQRGQFDQVIGPQKAHNRLMDLLVDFADQAVYSDTWVKDAVGEVSFGGGSYITLGPNGGIGRVPPAVSSLNVVQDLQMMEESVHLGGRWPKSRPGEIDQSIASAKFLEASAGMMNTVIKGYHMILKSMIETSMQLCFEMDHRYFAGKDKRAHGILRNQEFSMDYDASDIDLKNMVVVDYGVGLGKDPSQSAVLQIQYAQNEYISHEFVQESIEGLNDIQKERARIDAEKMKKIIFGKLIEAVQMGQISNRQLIDITKKRYEGEDLFDLFEEFVVKPEEEALAAGPGPLSGLTGMPMGGPPQLGPGGGGPPGPQPQEGGPPGQVPPAPDPAQMLARINTPAGPGGTLGAQTLTGG
ncbi:MAG: hypothetical protein HKO53_13165, partial [Gemmatimonadetes bacterium]|nr:hypothetical protein [Gemmatimonadota bacterium]